MKLDQSSFSVRQAYGSSVSQKVTQFLPLVRKLAWYYEGHGSATIDVDDLMQAGMMALTEAAQRHDRPSDDGFAAYAKMRVRGAMVDLLRGQSHRPRGAASWSRKRDLAEQKLRTQLGRMPDAREMAQAMEMPLDRYEAMRFAAATSATSIEECYSDSDTAFSDARPDQEQNLLASEDSTVLAQAIGALPERLQVVLKLYFIEELNLNEIAAVLGVSVPRVHQLKADALKKARVAMQGQGG
ncbi:sigma-70 family RNA polymerase sigma factor [Alteriqipengyuania lutimaris]|uniref:Flagellar protein n=1 Tax=Alteriqipengyuania lutimaris TaxID=1538146 RepID=A0A395LK66_9SPHN|nr:sigma-70 family RNA polymerase sigma factor [Alteriqipengyuania lutimaris]MBB3033968.1 RNA polymerase sigma factor for flagellar operon FliA [Alteriqipengyuania lutimaris]RDS77079.1 flagellar protein [Alteriqipengyuania lutimaris]